MSPTSLTPRRTRIRRSGLLKRQIVEQTLAPGASVALIARQHAVNANQVFAWRRLYRQGLLSADPPDPPAPSPSPTLLPVRLADRPATGSLTLEVAGHRLTIDGPADPDVLRIVLAALLR